jgi:hypothetical protein
LAALMKNRPQSIFIDMFFCHFLSYCNVQ